LLRHARAAAAPPPAPKQAKGWRRQRRTGRRRADHKLEPPRLDALRAESALLTEARAELRSGNAAGAQASLDRLQAQFPKGMLTQEREVLAIEVLSAQGNTEGAKRRPKAFVARYRRARTAAKLARFLE